MAPTVDTEVDPYRMVAQILLQPAETVATSREMLFMRLVHHVVAGLLSLFVLILSIGAVAAQTPQTDIDDLCASFVPATPVASASPEPVDENELPAIDAEDSVLGALARRQHHVVTVLQAIIASDGDPELVAFATVQLPMAHDQLDALQVYASDEVTAHPAAMVAVLDKLRQDQDLAADQGGLDAYLPGYVVESICPEGIDRDAVSQQILVSNDVAIVEIAAIGGLVVSDEDALELVIEVSQAASDRLAWFEMTEMPEATPAATPAT